MPSGNQGLPPQDIAGAQWLLVPFGWQEAQRLRHVRLVAEAERQYGARRARRQLLEGQPMDMLHVRRQGRADGEQQHAFVQHVIVLQAVQQGDRHAGGIAREIDRHARHPLDAGACVQEIFDRHGLARQPLGEQGAAASPGGEQQHQHGRDRQWQPGAVGDLGGGSAEQGEVEGQQHGVERDHPDPAQPPDAEDDEAHDQRRQHHGRGHREAEGRSQRRRRPEAQHKTDHGDAEKGVDGRDEHLPAFVGGGVDDLEPRQVAQLHRLLGDRKGAGNGALAGDHRSGGGERQQRPQRPAWCQPEEGLIDAAGSSSSSAAWPA